MPRDDSVEIQPPPPVDYAATIIPIHIRCPFITDHTTFALAVLLLAGIFLPAVCSSQELGHWWSDPCDKLRKVRHEGSQEVVTQLNNVISNLKHELPKLKRIFKTVCTISLLTILNKLLIPLFYSLQTMPDTHLGQKHPWLNFNRFRKAMKRQTNKDYVSITSHFH